MKRLIAFMLLLSITVLTSCGTLEELSGPTGSKTETAAEETILKYGGKQFDEYDFGGRNFVFAVRGDKFNEFACIDLYAEKQSGDLINDAVYLRNKTICEKFNFNITEIRTEDYPSEVVSKSVMAGDSEYDVVYDNLQRLANMAMSGELYDLTELPNVDYSQPYWDAKINAQLTLKHKLYYTTGEHMLSVKAGLYGVFFNKDIVNNLKLDDPYQLVAKGDWTISKMYEMATDISDDIDGNGTMDYKDRWGIVTETYNAYTFLVGSGNLITTKNKDDVPYLTLNTETSLKALEAAKLLLTDKNLTIIVDSYGSDMWDTVWAVFDDGRSLFCEGALMNTPKLRSSDLNFGILPSPKLDSKQEEYYHTISVWNASLMSIPVTVSDDRAAGLMLELLAASSYDTLRPAYYDLQLKNKLIRDTESEKMLDIIFSTITFDLGAVYDFGGLFWGVMSVGNGKADFASMYAGKENSANSAIEKLSENIK